MTISMYSASVPVFVKLLSNTLKWLDKAEHYAEAKKFDTGVYLSLRLAPDMLPFTRQIQIASDAAKGCVARLAGIENPKWEDNEASFADLRERINKTIAFVQSVTPAQIDGSEQRAIEIPTRSGEPLRFDGETYLKHFVLANFHFHLTMTYALLRHAGVELGKKDFLGG
ncbi:MAG: DUF1993 domain-containing protein [Burkholderiaceae bacterium]|nr:DUF1993 domain-containing protein [Burkholderiaceae bacterium]